MIERSLVEALHQAQEGSKQIRQARALKAVFDAFTEDGFQDIVPQAPKAPVEKQAVEIFSKDQLIIPETKIPQEVSDILQRAEKVGLTFFEPYHLSGITLQQDSNVEGWDKKPENWYWEQIKNKKISQNASKLPDAWILIDKTARPNYNNGKQLHENDPLGTLLARLRKDKKLKRLRAFRKLQDLRYLLAN